MSLLDIQALSGKVLCTVEVLDTMDKEEVKQAVASELHLPKGCFELVNTGELLNIVFRYDWEGWPKMFERAVEDDDEVCIENAFKALDLHQSFLEFRPLHLAVYHQRPNIVQKLIKLGADVNGQTVTGSNNEAVHIACKSGDLESLQILLDHGANADAENGAGDKPVHIAANRKDAGFMRLLIEAKADIDVKNQFGETPYDVAELMENWEIITQLEALC